MYNLMFVCGLIMTIVFLIISIILFFRNDVPNLIRDITGKNAKRNIRHMQRKDRRIPLKRKVNEQEVDLPEMEKTELLTKKTVTLKLYAGEETSLLLQEHENPMPEVFEVLEDITIYYNTIT